MKEEADAVELKNDARMTPMNIVDKLVENHKNNYERVRSVDSGDGHHTTNSHSSG